MKHSLLLVDADPKSRRVLEVSLRKAGYTVGIASDGEAALSQVRAVAPDLILADTELPGMDGFALVDVLREDPVLAKVPFLFLSSDTSIESKVRGLELGVEYLTKPIYVREVLTRVGLALEKSLRRDMERGSLQGTRFSGSLREMGIVDLLQTIDVSRKSGTLDLHSEGREGRLWFRDGAVIDAECEGMVGEVAVYRFLVWAEGTFELKFGEITRDPRIEMNTQALLMEGMRRVDEWGRLLEQIPPLEAIVEVAPDALLEQLADLPDQVNGLLRLFDGKRTLGDVVRDARADDLKTLQTLSSLYFEGLLVASDLPGGDPGEGDAHGAVTADRVEVYPSDAPEVREDAESTPPVPAIPVKAIEGEDGDAEPEEHTLP
ncbi:MAG: DUF4388 domain-containing protein, partial [Myxococcales bacterium]|nr:DUF4388 domain-containing protein [Myxococcales bacterium]